MRIQTILNRVEKFKSFVYGQARLEKRDAGPTLVVQVLPRKNGRPFCSGCGRPGPAYDRLDERHFEFVPLWGIVVYLAYRMRRVDCRRCGVTVEMVPWCDGKNQRLPFTVAVAVSVLRSVPVQSHWPIDDHWRFRPPTLASHHLPA
jgi:transposase